MRVVSRCFKVRQSGTPLCANARGIQAYTTLFERYTKQTQLPHVTKNKQTKQNIQGNVPNIFTTFFFFGVERAHLLGQTVHTVELFLVKKLHFIGRDAAVCVQVDRSEPVDEALAC